MKERAWLFLAAAALTAVPMGLSALEFRVTEESFPYPVEISELYLAGDFNSWNKDATPFTRGEDGWKVDLPLEDGRHRYKIVLVRPDGEVEWRLDPTNNVYVPDGLGGYNSAVFVKEDTRTKPPAANFEKFEWKDEEASTVVVTGPWVEWNARYLYLTQDKEDKVWRAWIEVERPFMYKYVVNDENWLMEEEAEGISVITDDKGYQNNFRGEKPTGAIPVGEAPEGYEKTEKKPGMPELPAHLDPKNGHKDSE